MALHILASPALSLQRGKERGKITLNLHSATQQAPRRCRSRNRSLVHCNQVEMRWSNCILMRIKSEWVGGFPYRNWQPGVHLYLSPVKLHIGWAGIASRTITQLHLQSFAANFFSSRRTAHLAYLAAGSGTRSGNNRRGESTGGVSKWQTASVLLISLSLRSLVVTAASGPCTACRAVRLAHGGSAMCLPTAGREEVWVYKWYYGRRKSWVIGSRDKNIALKEHSGNYGAARLSQGIGTECVEGVTVSIAGCCHWLIGRVVVVYRILHQCNTGTQRQNACTVRYNTSPEKVHNCF